MRAIGKILAGLGIACVVLSLLAVLVLGIVIAGMGQGGALGAVGAAEVIGVLVLGIPGGLLLSWFGYIAMRRPRQGYTLGDVRRGLVRMGGAVLAAVGALLCIGGLVGRVGRGPDPQGESTLATVMGLILSLVFLAFSAGIMAAGTLLWRRFRPPDPPEGVDVGDPVDVARSGGRTGAAEDTLTVHRCPHCRILNRVPDPGEGQTFECHYCGEVVSS